MYIIYMYKPNQTKQTNDLAVQHFTDYAPGTP